MKLFYTKHTTPLLYILQILLFSLNTYIVKSQDLEPRSLSTLPTGGNFAILSYGYSSGNILIDNSLPIKDLEANLNSIVIAYARSFNLLGKLAKFDIITPYTFGSFSGIVSSIDSSTNRTGFADPLARISIILIGAKAKPLNQYNPSENKDFKLGISFRTRSPLGQYDNTKFINLGANRWAFKTSIAGSYSFSKKLTTEIHISSWFFTTNNNFFYGNTVKQKPLISAQIHAIYQFSPSIWGALSLGQSGQGETIVNGIEKDDNQQNSKAGITFAYRIAKQHSIKASITNGISTRYGANFTTILITYQYMWFDK